jgi:hypothetical protein
MLVNLFHWFLFLYSKKKRIIPDNDEDYCIQSDQASKRVRIDESDIDEHETELVSFFSSFLFIF